MTQALKKLEAYITKEQYKGYDPYDTLNSYLPFHWFGKYGQAIPIQIQKRNPFNIRPLLGIKKEVNPKAVGLFLSAYAQQYSISKSEKHREKMEFFFNWLSANYTKGFSGNAWGYNFVWANPQKVLPKYSPSVVASAFVGRGLFDYYQQTKDHMAVDMLEGICRFVLEDLTRTETENGICFSYTTVKNDCCFNASLLGAEILAKTYSITKNDSYKELALKAIDFAIHYQKDDGRWNYNVNLDTGKEQLQVDFHQGYVLDSIYETAKYCGAKDNMYQESFAKGLSFYFEEQVLENGQTPWRLPRKWPVEIHNQAQMIIMLSKYGLNTPELKAKLERVIDYTISNMQDKEGFFYYQKHSFYTIKIPYMRWSQAWMFLALSTYLRCTEQATAGE